MALRCKTSANKKPPVSGGRGWLCVRKKLDPEGILAGSELELGLH